MQLQKIVIAPDSFKESMNRTASWQYYKNRHLLMFMGIPFIMISFRWLMVVKVPQML